MAPLQAYASALMFSPRESLIRQIYENQRFTDMKLHNPPELAWSPCIRTLESHGSYCNSLRLTHNDQRVVACLTSGIIEVWDVVTGECWTRTPLGTRDETRCYSSAVSTDGRLAYLGLVTGVIEVWDLVESTLINEVTEHDSIVVALVLSSDEQTVTSVEFDGAVRHWNLSTSAVTFTKLQNWRDDVDIGLNNGIYGYTLSPNGRLLAVRIVGMKGDKRRQQIQIYNTLDGSRVKIIRGTEYSHNVAFSKDGQEESQERVGRKNHVGFCLRRVKLVMMMIMPLNEKQRIIAFYIARNNSILGTYRRQGLYQAHEAAGYNAK